MIVKFKRLSKEAVMPQKAHPSDAGFDMTAISVNVTDQYVEYCTGIAAQLPAGYMGLLFPRSSNSKKDLLLCNSVGVWDQGYTGELRFRFKKIINPEHPEEFETYSPGDKIGQIVIMPYPEIEFVETQEFELTDRGADGFGSTGK